MIRYIPVTPVKGILPFTHICLEIDFNPGILENDTGAVRYCGYIMRGYPVKLANINGSMHVVQTFETAVKLKHLVKISHPHPAAQQQALLMYSKAAKEMCTYFSRKYNLKCNISF